MNNPTTALSEADENIEGIVSAFKRSLHPDPAVVAARKEEDRKRQRRLNAIAREPEIREWNRLIAEITAISDQLEI